jgi:hypothetical protein
LSTIKHNTARSSNQSKQINQHGVPWISTEAKRLINHKNKTNGAIVNNQPKEWICRGKQYQQRTMAKEHGQHSCIDTVN